ncbi:hypothetical protein GCM10014715_63830 [Streptomyces spiralis]|uniref:Uncharacterized protein n=1 Tax=Streptomyces spiralis TaxID=66376 RepID=A0A919ADR1_9ACTN|nr:hypothetical protein GCM10014715_63830 [Streptomyces spiralis]
MPDAVDEPLAFEERESFTHRSAADSQRGGEFDLTQLRSGREVAGEDRLAYEVGGLLRQSTATGFGERCDSHVLMLTFDID